MDGERGLMVSTLSYVCIVCDSQRESWIVHFGSEDGVVWSPSDPVLLQTEMLRSRLVFDDRHRLHVVWVPGFRAWSSAPEPDAVVTYVRPEDRAKIWS